VHERGRRVHSNGASSGNQTFQLLSNLPLGALSPLHSKREGVTLREHGTASHSTSKAVALKSIQVPPHRHFVDSEAARLLGKRK
jgi:hypothetical protein